MNADKETASPEPTHEDDDRAAKPSGEEDRPTSPLDMAKERIVELEASLKEAQDRELRTQAELDNFRKRIRREMDDDRKFASIRLIEDLLPVGDDLTRALESAKSEGNADSAIVAGVQMVLQRFKTSLERHHCREIDTSCAFDPNQHEAVAQIPNDAPQGTILQVARPGYVLHDRVVRPAQVVVSAGKSA